MRTLRSFLALKLDLSTVENIAAAQKRVKTACKNAGMTVRWVPPPNIHLTIRFLGQITAPMAHAVKDMLEPIISKTASFEIESLGMGAFPDVSRPRTIWAGLGQGTEQVSELHAAVYNRLIKAGFNLDDRPFAAHITIGRVKEGPPLVFAECLGEDTTRNFGLTMVKHFYCYRSDLTPSGAEYEALWVLPFQEISRKPTLNERTDASPDYEENSQNGEPIK